MTHLGILARLAAATGFLFAGSVVASANCPQDYSPCGKDNTLCCPKR